MHMSSVYVYLHLFIKNRESIACLILAPRQDLRQAQIKLRAISTLNCSSVGDLERKKGTIRALFESKWLPGTDSNRRPSGYKCPGISTRLGLSHHPSPKLELRVSGASPPSLSRRVRAEALVSAPSLNNDNPGLGSGLPFFTCREGQASLNSPDFSTTISRGSCVTQPPALPTELPGSSSDGI